jgi:TM2 domain-containing membrane protein YozV
VEFFPKENKIIRYQDALFYLIVLGTFGVHQFYLGNKKRGYYLLATCGISHLMVLTGTSFTHYISGLINPASALFIVFAGYALGAPVWLYDLVTLDWQVKKAKLKQDFENQRMASPPV